MKQTGGSCVLMLAMILAVSLLALAPLAMADTASGETATPPSCSEDVAKFCKDVQPGGGRIMQCLNKNRSELSPACKTHIEEAASKMKEMQDACKNDVATFCKDVQPGGGRIIKCMKAHESELSMPCREKMSQAKRP